MQEDKNKNISDTDNDDDQSKDTDILNDDIFGEDQYQEEDGKSDDDAGADKDEDEKNDDLDYDLLDDDIDEEKKEDAPEEENLIVIPKSKALLIKKILRNIKENADQVTILLSGLVRDEDEERISIGQIGELEILKEKDRSMGNEKIIEGVFDGERMIGPDGKQYTVPANYASKSKLVEGDMLKLTITGNGTFLYKQIGPIERSRVVGVLEKDDDGNFHVVNKNKKWKVITASVTYFRGDAGDEAVILIPKAGESKWAAIENIVKTV